MYIYENSSLKFMSQGEGYIEPDGTGGYDYVYQYKDHLGNIRLSYSDLNGDGMVDGSEIMDEKNYYPFGWVQRGYNNQVQGTYYPYGFNGKEENNKLDLKWLDFGARNYDATLGRWMNLDPLAEMMTRYSPYNYAFDDPLRFIDPDGMAPEDLILKEADGSGTESVDKAVKLINEGLGGEYASVDKEGKVSLSATEKQIAGFTKEQKGFYDTINSAVSAEGDVTIKVGEGSESVLIGSYALEEIDMTDINNFGTGEAVNKFSTFGHEVKEQQEKQLGTTEEQKSYKSSHAEGFKVENAITGYTRQPGVAPTTRATQSATGKINGNVDVLYKNSTHTVKASINITNNNVTKVVRTKTENKKN